MPTRARDTPASSRPRRARPPAGAPRGARVPAAALALLDLLPEPAALLDADGRVRAVNAALADWLGVASAAPVGRAFAELLTDADRAAAVAALERALEGRAATTECRLNVAGGRAVPVEVLFADRRSGAPLHGVLATLRDQSARHAQERLVADSQLRLDLALWGSQIGFWENDIARNDTRWFTAWCEQLGIEPCDGADHVERWDALIHPDDRAAACASYEAGLAGTREYYEAEYRYATRDGTWRWIRERGRVVERDADGRARRVIGICVDIDTQKRTEEALRHVQARLDLALEAAQLPVWEWRVREGTLRIDRPGQPAEVEQRLERVHPADAPRLLEALDAAGGEAGPLFEAEYRRRTPRGGWQWVVDRGRVTETDAAGVVVVRGVTIDIDDRKRLEAAVLDAVNREQQRLGRDLHDGLSQELTGATLLLRSSLSRLERDGHDSADAIREALAVVQTAMETSRRVAQGLSSLTTLQGGLEDALAELAARLAAASAVPVAFHRNVHASVALDAVQAEHLYRIAAEAITNALRHARPAAVRVDLDVASDEIRLAIGDDGHGVPAGRIGAGLGTRIMKYRADVLGARFRIERRAPRGTLVECVCPNRAASPPPASA